MQDGFTSAYLASYRGHTNNLAFLLANKADINAASKVQQLKILDTCYSFTTSDNIKTKEIPVHVINYFSTSKHELLLSIVHVKAEHSILKYLNIYN
jgi:hypothetical protein